MAHQASSKDLEAIQERARAEGLPFTDSKSPFQLFEPIQHHDKTGLAGAPNRLVASVRPHVISARKQCGIDEDWHHKHMARQRIADL